MMRAGPAPLWRFGWVGAAAVVAGGGILIAELCGAQFLRRAMELMTALIGWPTMTSVLFGFYGAVDRYGNWYDPQGMMPGASPLVLAGLAAGMVIGERPGRWWVLGLGAAASLVWRGLLFGGNPLFRAYLNWTFGGAVSRDVSIVLWLWAPLAGLGVLVWLWTRSARTGWWLLGLVGAGLAIAMADEVRAVSQDQLVAAALPAARWGWLVAWWAWAVRWGLEERRARFPAPSVCRGCGYDLSGLTGPCPECGGQQPDSKACTKSS